MISYKTVACRPITATLRSCSVEANYLDTLTLKGKPYTLACTRTQIDLIFRLAYTLKSEDTLVGSITLYSQRDTWDAFWGRPIDHPLLELWMEKVKVHTDYRKCGIGSFLIYRSISDARKLLKTLTDKPMIFVDVSNAEVKFYEIHNFAVLITNAKHELLKVPGP